MKLKKNIKLLIAVDGGAGSGKTTGAKLISKKYKLNLLSSGILYRYIAFKLINNKTVKNKKSFLIKTASKITLKKLKDRKLYSPEVTEYTSEIAKNKFIRGLLKKFQKDFSKKNLVCIEGRDIGSIICPNADLKFFFKCTNLNVRAKRRLRDFRKFDNKISLNDVKKALKARDYIDSRRKHSPLRVLKDSIIIDSSKVNKKQMLVKLSKIIESKLKNKYAKFKQGWIR